MLIYILKVSAGLIGVIALILFTYYGTRWLNKSVRLNPNSIIKIVERIGLGPDKSIVIVSVGDKYLMLGITQEHIDKIAELDQTQIEGILSEKKNSSSNSSFHTQLMGILEKMPFNKNKDGD